MKDILAEIIQKKKAIVAEEKRQLPLDEMKRRLEPGTFRMSHQLEPQAWSLIAECKLQSPAKGRLCSRHSVTELARIYEQNGASMLSVHTDPHFLGRNEDIAEVRAAVKLPILRKDFVIDAYQIYQARHLGADAVLLIARILTPQQLKEFVAIAGDLGMDALVEVHDQADLLAAQATPAKFIGINNRNLENFTTDIQNTLDLLPHCDKDRIIISESGIHDRSDINRLKAAGVQGILVGESLVRAEDIGAKTRELSLTDKAAAEKSAEN